MTTPRVTRWFLTGAVAVALGGIGTVGGGEPRGKGRIERPVKEAVAKSDPTPPADNPTVDTGKVKWHKTLEDAQAAAKKSHKPVLLFQMMGYLDKKFC